MKITMRDLLKSGVHFGHQKKYWNPKMAPFIYGIHEKTHIINLEKTLPLLKEAMNFVGSVAAKKGNVMFVGTKHSARNLVKEYAEKCNMPFINHRWLGGLLTNYRTVRRSIKKLKDLDVQFETQAFGKLTKKEILNLTRARAKLELSLGGIKDMKGLPEVLFVIDVEDEHTAIKEAQKMRIPVVAIVDTNNSPDGIDYVIPGNDDAISAIKIYLEAMSDSILNAKSSGVAYAEIIKEAGNEDDFVEVSEAEEK